jgi:hypothetical protein
MFLVCSESKEIFRVNRLAKDARIKGSPRAWWDNVVGLFALPVSYFTAPLRELSRWRDSL